MADGKKTDLRLFGEIDKRFATLGETGRVVLYEAIANGATAADLEVVKQIVERRSQLTEDGKLYADKQVGISDVE